MIAKEILILPLSSIKISFSDETDLKRVEKKSSLYI